MYNEYCSYFLKFRSVMMPDFTIPCVWRVDSEPRTECTTSSLEVMKKCLDGIKVDLLDHECLLKLHTKLIDVDNKACF